MPIFTAEGMDIYYEIHGSGPPLMLLAGLASDSHSWLTVLPDLSDHFMLIVPDNRGVGRSTQTGIDISIELIADDCMNLLEHLGIPSACMLGHSMGGLVAIDCAKRYPEKVSRLMLAATTASVSRRNNAIFRNWSCLLESGTPKALWLMDILPWLLTAGFFDNRHMVELLVQCSLDYPYQQETAAFRNQIEAIAQYDCSGSLGSIKARTLIMHGREDLLFPWKESIDTLNLLADAEVRIIERAAHSIHMEQPGEFVNTALQFMGLKQTEIQTVTIHNPV